MFNYTIFTHIFLEGTVIYKVDNVKYFKIEFESEEEDKWTISELIEEGFKTNEYNFKNPGIKSYEFTINCNHSKNYIALKLQTADKKGIITFVIQING